jgi:hypothetical protein
MGSGIKIPWFGVQYTLVGGSKYHGLGFAHICGHENVFQMYNVKKEEET